MSNVFQTTTRTYVCDFCGNSETFESKPYRTELHNGFSNMLGIMQSGPEFPKEIGAWESFTAPATGQYSHRNYLPCPACRIKVAKAIEALLPS